MAHILLATIGSLGDLHPFIAIGRALREQGQRVTLAVPEDGVAKARAAGLDAAPILPSYASVCARLRLSESEVAARILADTGFVLDEILMPALHESSVALDRLADSADVVAASVFAFAAEIVAEKRSLPLAGIVLQPMTLFSALQPPRAPRFELMCHRPRSMLGEGWNRLGYATIRRLLRTRYGSRIDAVRASHGLGSRTGAPMLDHSPATAALLCCWSAPLGSLPPDAPAGAVLTGFPFFDSESGSADAAIDPALADFLAEGDAPLVFSLGSFAVAAAGRFYERAAAVARQLNRRAVLLTGQPGAATREGDCLSVGYAPHSMVFPHAAAIVHHGGAGSSGQALRAGRPQLIVPHFGDQYDNAARLVDAGVARRMNRAAFTAKRAAPIIAELLESAAIAQCARSAAEAIAQEGDGAANAARAIIGLANGEKSTHPIE
ncbi:glycosyltransferase [Sphingomonas sp.]|uniref:glycosyltransferase n=1 Tax=Sphingomonas sp. TaxID=28214 RepID=UPI001840CC85|nr:glycosyltransferase [Sphingomonas sp.]MBA4760785.1 glycosyltransferase family 1 protein [Sphingomonas sp.]